VYPLVQIENTNQHKKLNTNKNYKIISAGAVGFRKGFDLWVDTAISVVKKNKNVHFEWYGKLEGGDKEYFKYYMDKIPKEFKKQYLI
jgi:glycosyltransferase involved in cell wall biosynthesis